MPVDDRADVLCRLSEALAESRGGLPAVLDLASRAASAVLGGCCLVWDIAPSGRELVLASVHDPDRARAECVRHVFGHVRHPLGQSLLAQVMLSAVPVVFDPVPWGELGGWEDDTSVEALAEMGPGSLVAVPLNARSLPVGILGVVSPARRASASSDDDGDDDPAGEQALLREIGDRVAVAIDNARLLEAIEREQEERRRLETAAGTREIMLAALCGAAPFLLFSCDANGTLLHLDGDLVGRLAEGTGPFRGKGLLAVLGRHAAIADLAGGALAGGEERHERVRLEEDLELEAWVVPIHGRDGELNGCAGLLVQSSPAGAVAGEADRRQAALVEHASDVIIVMQPDGRVRYANPAARRVLGYDWKEGDVVDVLSLVHPEDHDRCRDEIRAALHRPGTQEPVVYRLRHADGSYRLVHSIGNNLLGDPAVGGVVVTLRDITDESSASERARMNADRQEALADLGRWALAGLAFDDLVADAMEVLAEHCRADVVHVFDALPDADFLSLSACLGDELGRSELLSADPTSSPASYALGTQETLECSDLRHEERFDVPELWTRPDLASVIEVPVPGADMPVGVLGIASRLPGAFSAEDVNFVKAVGNVLASAMARTRAETAIRQQALQDPLTGLPNRLVLADHLSEASSLAGNLPAMSGADRTVFVLDLDRFKEINDTLGHAVGDLVLLEVARRLRRLGEPVEIVSRLGGDEFALVARLPQHDEERLASRAEEDALAAHVLSIVGAPLDVGGVNLRLRASIGIASADVNREGKALEVPALLRRAEAAMYQAKSEHQGVRRYSDDLERSSLSRLALASELAEAIDLGQLRLDYQPKVRCADGGVAGVEALVRWQHPTRGLLLPDVFVPLAEQTGIVRELTGWVLQRALAECAAWHRAGHAIPVAVNLSAGTVHDPSLLESVMTATTRSGLPSAAVELEITESAVMRDPVGALRSLEALTSHGVRFALDDFGTGYSSLGYLQRLPVASVKLDKSFVMPLNKGTDSVASAIVRAVVDLGHSLNLDVIAEGVDSEVARAAVTALGCDAMQGFLIAMPMDPKTLQSWLSQHAVRPLEERPGDLVLPE